MAQSKSGGWVWTVIIIVAVLAGGYYYETHKQAPATEPAGQGQPGQTPIQSQPGQAPAQGQPGAPTQTGSPSQPGVYPEQQPGVPAQSENNAALVRTQMFGGRWDPVNGVVQISQARWTNNATVIIQSSTLECVQYAANGAILTQSQTRLNGPIQPRATLYFGPFQMGSMVPNLAKVNCGIVGVTPTGQ
jgi:hypothetical protein